VPVLCQGRRDEALHGHRPLTRGLQELHGVGLQALSPGERAAETMTCFGRGEVCPARLALFRAWVAGST
jgi:hypothetical protein